MTTRDDAYALSSLGTGLAHALRNPLNSALLELALAQRKLARDNRPVPGEIVEATHELLRAATLLEDFLSRIETIADDLL
jgi:signal transduction histidine kinase